MSLTDPRKLHASVEKLCTEYRLRNWDLAYVEDLTSLQRDIVYKLVVKAAKYFEGSVVEEVEEQSQHLSWQQVLATYLRQKNGRLAAWLRKRLPPPVKLTARIVKRYRLCPHVRIDKEQDHLEWLSESCRENH